MNPSQLQWEPNLKAILKRLNLAVINTKNYMKELDRCLPCTFRPYSTSPPVLFDYLFCLQIENNLYFSSSSAKLLSFT